MKFMQTIGLALIASLAIAGYAQAAIDVTYNGEAAGVENTTASFTFSAVETFNSQPIHTYPNTISQTFSNGAATPSTITMEYTGADGIQINSADEYGGAGGNSNYIVAFRSTPYTLHLSSTNLAGGVNYFGYWLSALDSGNKALFYGQNGQLLLTFSARDLINLLAHTPNSTKYYGNPNPAFAGRDASEPFVFLNFYDTSGSFSKIVFEEAPTFGGGYESDNHTVGHFTGAETGTPVPLVASIPGAVPEPATWAMMLTGFGSLGMGMRMRRRQFDAFA